MRITIIVHYCDAIFYGFRDIMIYWSKIGIFAVFTHRSLV